MGPQALQLNGRDGRKKLKRIQKISSTGEDMSITEASTSRFVTAGGVKIHYNEAGSGPALVLIHGGGPGASG